MHHIAHIEDNIADHVFLNKTIGANYRITHFPTLKSFLDNGDHFDLIVTDLGLPEAFGLETLRAIKNRANHAPILVLTGLAGPYMSGDIVQTLMRCGADNVVSKDIINDTRLITIIAELLAQ